jgi:hypothetical protein
VPVKPGAQKHVPDAHVPWPLHWLGHDRGLEQSGPPNPASQAHAPDAHLP